MARVFVNEQLVLDTTPADPEQPRPDEAFVSQPVPLTAGQAVPIRVEYVYDDRQIARSVAGLRIRERMLHPMLVLAWSTGNASPEIIPATAYTPPEADQGEAARGVRAEYFAATDFQQPAGTRLELGVNFISSFWAPAVALYEQQTDAVLAEYFEQLTGQAYRTLTSPDPAAGPAFVWNPAWGMEYARLATVTDGPNRQVLLGKLLGNVDFAPAQPVPFALTWRSLVMFPGDGPLQLLAAWADAWPKPQAEIPPQPHPLMFARFHDAHQMIGQCLRQNYRERLDKLIADELVDDAGFPRLRLVCIAAIALVDDGRGGEVPGLVAPHLDDPTLSDAQKSAWLSARALCSEILTQEPYYPAVALPDFEAAVLATNDPEWKFYAAREAIARRICLNQCDQALTMIEDARGWFSDPAMTAELDQFQAHAERLEPLFEEYDAAQQLAAQRAADNTHAARLRERIEKAQTRGDSALAAKYQQQLEQLDTQ